MHLFLSWIWASVSIWMLGSIRTYSFSHFRQRFQFFSSNQVKFSYKVIEMLKTRVYVSLSSDTDDSIKMMNVNVDKDTK